MGGGSTTLVAGVVAASWGKAVFATPHFHGKAEILYKWMHTASSVIASAPVNEEDIDLMSRPWSSITCVQSMERQLQEVERRSAASRQQQVRISELQNTLARIQSSGNRSWVVITVVIAFIVSMVGAISTESSINDFVWFFLVLFFGGALGASLSLLGTQRHASLSILTAGVVGGGVGIIVGVLQIAPNLSTVFTGTGNPKVGIELVFSSAVFALLGGLAFESTLHNLVSRGQNIGKESPPSDSDEGTRDPAPPFSSSSS